MTIKRFVFFSCIGCAIGVLISLYAFYRFESVPAFSEEAIAVIQKEDRKPSARYSVKQVVKIQLHALQTNTASDEGIATVFNFSSPTNREQTGPLTRFKLLVKTEAYRDLLNFKSCKFSKVIIDENQAQQVVELITSNNKKVYYLFQLSKQTEQPYKGCWMTDGVIRLDDRKEKVGTDV